MKIEQWMSWEGGVDLVGITQPGDGLPNVILHVARMVHTPVGSAPSGMIFWQPDSNAAPLLAGFISHDLTVGAYFGPHIFAGTPFENAPVLEGTVEINHTDDSASARVTVGNWVFESHLEGLSALELIHRRTDSLPFYQQGAEAGAAKATLKVNGEEVPVTLPPQTMSGGPAAVWAPIGIYAR